jgi:hypothetical protein
VRRWRCCAVAVDLTAYLGLLLPHCLIIIIIIPVWHVHDLLLLLYACWALVQHVRC